MTFRLLPRDPKFFELFIADGDNLEAAAGALNEMVEQYDRLDERIAAIQALEKVGDEIDREVTRKLEDAFVTPFDREDIHELENEADGLSRAAVAKLFRDDLPPIEVIKWRDLYNYLEEAIDAAEDAAEAMERMYHKAN